MEMSALHPPCGGKGCEECGGSGYLQAVVKGDCYTVYCPQCGLENGVQFVDEGLTLPEVVPGPCLICRACNVVWKLVGRIE